jgi:hypothetical protein
VPASAHVHPSTPPRFRPLRVARAPRSDVEGGVTIRDGCENGPASEGVVGGGVVAQDDAEDDTEDDTEDFGEDFGEGGGRQGVVAGRGGQGGGEGGGGAGHRPGGDVCEAECIGPEQEAPRELRLQLDRWRRDQQARAGPCMSE